MANWFQPTCQPQSVCSETCTLLRRIVKLMGTWRALLHNHFPKDFSAGEAAHSPIPSLGSWVEWSGLGKSHFTGMVSGRSRWKPRPECFHFTLLWAQQALGIWGIGPTPWKCQLHYLTWQHSIIFSRSVSVVSHERLLKPQNKFRTTNPPPSTWENTWQKNKLNSRTLLCDSRFY